MQIYADPDFIRGFSHLHPEEKEAVESCLYKLKNRDWDVGLRVKRLKGFPKRVWEARVNRSDRLLFLIAPATHKSSGASGSLYILDLVGHDHVTRVRRRDLTASSYLSFVVEQAQQPTQVEEEFSSCSREQLEHWALDEAQSGAATEHLRAYAQQFVASAEQISTLSDTDRELWLTEEQMAVVMTEGHGILSGTAGSGKTTMAVQWLLADIGNTQPKLYLAYNPWLVDYARELFQRLLPRNGHEAFKDIVHFKTVHQIVREYLGSRVEDFSEEREVRFSDFQLPYKAWNRQIPPATAWSEIRSIIKGACLDPKLDLLDLKEYRNLGRSRSAYLHQDREIIHKVAQQYQKWIKEKQRYDEIDLCRQAIRQVQSQHLVGYDTIVCDEVQDLTELQLEFIFLLNSNDGRLFFTGDLNQIINPSGFRWEEVNSQFYRRKQQKPRRQHLSYNFRSVGSIVKLADAILRLRERLTSSNLELGDRQQDYHLQEGQKPRLLTATDEVLVKSLVARLTGQIAILVRTEAQRNRLKIETDLPFIFTIEEAKGLEFDRTLVWDFFRDQQSLWRKALTGVLAAKENPALRHEMNLLYVAATRPRRNLYFYDPYKTIWTQTELEGAFDYAVPEVLAEEEEERLTPEQWRQQGKYYLDREFFEQALFCFRQSEDRESVLRVQARIMERNKKWSEAGEQYLAMPDFMAAGNAFEKDKAWGRASKAYQRAEHLQDALRCDAQAAESEKQWEAASRIWNSLGQTTKALDAIRKTNNLLVINPIEAMAFAVEGKHDRAATLYEQVADWDNAIQQWEQAERWQEAANIYLKTERYAEAGEYAAKLAPSPERTKLRMSIQIAQNNLEEARWIAQSELTLAEAIKFFQQAGQNSEAYYFEARLAEEKGKLLSALRLWRQIGNQAEIDRISLLMPEQKLSAQTTLASGRTLSVSTSQLRLNTKTSQLFEAAAWENVAAVSDLLAEGADIDGQTESGRTALMAGASFGNTEVLQMLLNAGAETETKDSDGWTSLMWAATDGNVKAVELLLNHGADRELKDKDGKTALILAGERNHKAIVEMLRNYQRSGQFSESKFTAKDDPLQRALTQDIVAKNNAVKTEAELYRDQGNIEVGRQQWAVAVSNYLEAIKLDPDLPGVHINFENALAELDRWQEALVHFQTVLDKDPNNLLALTNTGNAQVRVGKFDEAIKHYKKALAIEPNDALARYNLSATLELKQVANPPIQDNPEASLRRHQAEVAANPDNVVALFNMGYCLQELSQASEAVVAYRKAISYGLSHSALFTNLAICLHKLGQLDAAIRIFKKGIEVAPENGGIRNGLGMVLAEKGYFHEALAAYEKAVSINPADYEALTNIGNLLASEGRLRESTKYYERALNANYSFMKAHINLACNYRDQGDDAKAMEQYQKAIKIDPHHANVRANLGFLFLKIGDDDSAATEFKASTAINPEHANAHFGLGRCLLKRELWEEAVKEFQIAHRLAPQDAEANFYLGMAHVHNNQISAGLAQAREAVKLDRNLLP